MRIHAPHYRRQIGGSLSIFRGARRQDGGALAIFKGAKEYQYGRGIGSILKSVGKVVGPLARKYGPSVLKIGKKFVKHAIRAREAGSSWGDAAKEGLLPAAKTAFKEASEPSDMPLEETEQKGSGLLWMRHRSKKNQRGGGGARGRLVFKDLLKRDCDNRPTHYNF